MKKAAACAPPPLNHKRCFSPGRKSLRATNMYFLQFLQGALPAFIQLLIYVSQDSIYVSRISIDVSRFSIYVSRLSINVEEMNGKGRRMRRPPKTARHAFRLAKSTKGYKPSPSALSIQKPTGFIPIGVFHPHLGDKKFVPLTDTIRPARHAFGQNDWLLFFQLFVDDLLDRFF